MRILVVDDSPLVRGRIVSSLSEIAAAEVREARDARSALETLRNAWFDLLVLDLQLPDQSGLVVLSHARASRTVGVVAVLTGNPSEPHRRECALRGADHFFDKALQFGEVVDLAQNIALRLHGPPA